MAYGKAEDNLPQLFFVEGWSGCGAVLAPGPAGEYLESRAFSMVRSEPLSDYIIGNLIQPSAERGASRSIPMEAAHRRKKHFAEQIFGSVGIRRAAKQIVRNSLVMQ